MPLPTVLPKPKGARVGRCPRVLLIPLLVATAGAPVVASAASAAPATACSAKAADAQLASRRALSPLVPNAITPLPGGGQAYVYTVNGATVTLPVPPAGFDPLTASAAKLQEYGFQGRPDSSSPAYRSWLETMTSYRRTASPEIALGPAPVQPFHSAASARNAPDDGFVTGNWGGWLADASSQAYVATEMDFNEPSVSTPSCAHNTHAAWTGLGGFNSAQLVQDGIEVPTSAISLCSSKSSGYCAWYEYLNANNPNPPVIMGKVTVNAGDSIHLYTVYSASLGQVNFYVADNTTGTSQSVVISGIGSSYYDGSTGDFIGSEAASGTSLKHFSQFSTRNSYEENQSGNWIPISSAQFPTKATETNGGDTLATTGGLNGSGTGFTMTWVACS